MKQMKPIAITYKQYGGKASLAKWIVSHFPEHRVYMEPFCGSCAVLFAKPKSFTEIVNDLDGRVISMFEQIRSEPEKLAALLWATPYSSTNWRNAGNGEDALEDARLLMAQGVQFYCGSGRTSTWSLDKCGAPHKPKGEVWAVWFLRIAPAAVRLKSVCILHEDALKAIGRVYQQEDTFIYVDPPYYGHENEYRFGVNYLAMVEMLEAAKAKVMVSEYPAAASFYSAWRRIDKETVGRARTGAHLMKAKAKTEVLYCNW
jgi:DNA adenine methylase